MGAAAKLCKLNKNITSSIKNRSNSRGPYIRINGKRAVKELLANVCAFQSLAAYSCPSMSHSRDDRDSSNAAGQTDFQQCMPRGSGV